MMSRETSDSMPCRAHVSAQLGPSDSGNRRGRAWSISESQRDGCYLKESATNSMVVAELAYLDGRMPRVGEVAHPGRGRRRPLSAGV